MGNDDRMSMEEKVKKKLFSEIKKTKKISLLNKYNFKFYLTLYLNAMIADRTM